MFKHWFLILWVFFLLSGIILLRFSTKEWYIDWIKKRRKGSEQEIKNSEKRTALGIIIMSILYILQYVYHN